MAHPDPHHALQEYTRVATNEALRRVFLSHGGPVLPGRPQLGFAAAAEAATNPILLAVQTIVRTALRAVNARASLCASLPNELPLTVFSANDALEDRLRCAAVCTLRRRSKR